MGYNYMDPEAEAYHKSHPEKPIIGTEERSARWGRAASMVTDPAKGYVGSYDPYTTTGRASGGRLVELLQFAAVACRRLRHGPPASTIAAKPHHINGPTSARNTV